MSESEGVVKFHLDHAPAALPSHPALEDLMRLRDDLHRRGLVGENAQGVGYGNVSVRCHGNAFIISGTGTGHCARLGKNGYSLVLECDMAANRVRSRGPAAASSESMTHYAVYAACPKVGCVLHIHSRALFDALLRRKVPATPADAAYGTPAMAEAVSILAAGREAGLIVMTGHDEGVLAFGPDCPSALAVLTAYTDEKGAG